LEPKRKKKVNRNYPDTIPGTEGMEEGRKKSLSRLLCLPAFLEELCCASYQKSPRMPSTVQSSASFLPTGLFAYSVLAAPFGSSHSHSLTCVRPHTKKTTPRRQKRIPTVVYRRANATTAHRDRSSDLPSCACLPLAHAVFQYHTAITTNDFREREENNKKQHLVMNLSNPAFGSFVTPNWVHYTSKSPIMPQLDLMWMLGDGWTLQQSGRQARLSPFKVG